MPLLKTGKIITDFWTRIEDDQEFAEAGAVIVSLKRWLNESDNLRKRNEPIGVSLRNDQSPSQIIDDLEAISLVQLDFPAYTDGRAYSAARLLRQRYGFKGEIRAAGNVLRDQYPLMLRCGFDAFIVNEGIDLAGWQASVEAMDTPYQNAADNDTRPVWAKRHGIAQAS